MTGENILNPPLTPEQEEMADFLLEQCGPLREEADSTLEMMGATGTVRYGLGRCAHHLTDMTPEEITDMVMLKLDQQRSSA